ncbi:MAG: hypothetical protein E6I76_20905 [Chloroflexi bacterium]|nr:MAG: hypothetical protein E6I76_20905 [Chloroflexota bacterium]
MRTAPMWRPPASTGEPGAGKLLALRAHLEWEDGHGWSSRGGAHHGRGGEALRSVAVDPPAAGQHLRFSRQACVEFLRATGAAELAGRVERLRPLGGTPVEGVATGQAGPD